MNKERIVELRLTSGSVKSSDPLVSFLYELMRSYITPGDVETILANIIEEQSNISKGNNKDYVIFTNGYLANYAINIASKLKEYE